MLCSSSSGHLSSSALWLCLPCRAGRPPSGAVLFLVQLRTRDNGARAGGVCPSTACQGAPAHFSSLRMLLPWLLHKRHTFGCALKNIPYANGMSPSAKEGRAVFKGKTITEMRYSQRGTKEPTVADLRLTWATCVTNMKRSKEVWDQSPLPPSLSIFPPPRLHPPPS